MFVQLIDSMDNRKLATCYYLEESLNKFMTGSNHNFLSVCYNQLHLVPKQQIVSIFPIQSLFIEYYKTKQNVCNPFVRCEFIIWNSMAKGSQWHCFLFSQQLIFLKQVSDAGHFATGHFGHVVLFYRLWVTLKLLWKAVRSHLLYSQ